MCLLHFFIAKILELDLHAYSFILINKASLFIESQNQSFFTYIIINIIKL